MRDLFSTFFVLLLLGLAAPAAGAADCPDFDSSHARWDSLLKKHVSPRGLVDYQGFKGDRKALNAYLGTLEGVCEAQYKGWTQKEKLAYWINVYNAYTIELILRHYPLDSIRSIGWLPNSAFRDEFIPITFHTGEKLSLDDVEHEIMRKEFSEPRIHFAVNCASMSCPPLRTEAYTGEALDRQLEAATRSFLRDPKSNRYDAGENVLYLSKIFDWFEEDFEKAAGSVRSFVTKYMESEQFRTRRPDIDFLDYDWSLNEQP